MRLLFNLASLSTLAHPGRWRWQALAFPKRFILGPSQKEISNREKMLFPTDKAVEGNVENMGLREFMFE